jgi:chemotaxis regulatin CheY-phosphate phosphatase CheZ
MWTPHPLATPRKESTDMPTASQNIQDVQQSAKEKVAREKDRAADTVDNLAGALREAVRGPGSDERAAHMAEWAADGLERVSATLRSNDLNAMMRQAESFARSQPVAFFFAAAAAGFLATRFLKAGSSSSNLPE